MDKTSTQLNPDAIASITLFKKVQNNWFEYRKGIKFWFITIQKSGFYEKIVGFGHVRRTPEEIKSGGTMYCENGCVYYKPHMNISMNNKTVFTKWFEDEQQMEKVAGNIRSLTNAQWIKI